MRVNSSDINPVAPLRLITSLETLVSKKLAEQPLHENLFQCEGMNFIRNVMVNIRLVGQ